MSFTQNFLRVPAVVLGIGLGLLTGNCTPVPQTTRFLVDQHDRTVGMEVTYREGSHEYSHPRNLSAGILDQALQLIVVQPSSLLERITGASSTSQEAFSQDQRGFLANHLATAFKKVSPLETVTFYWATPRGNGIWEITSGGLYLQENDLHLVLPNYRQTVPAKNPPQQPKSAPLARIGESLHSLKSIDPARQLTHSFVAELWSSQTPHFVFPLNKLADGHMHFNPQQAKPSSSPQISGKSIKERLQTLDELRQEGLLTETEYQHKRQEILKKL